MTVTEQQILDALKTVIDPDRDRDIVSLGMVSGLAMREGHISFSIEVPAARGPALEPLRKSAEKTVENLPGVLSVTAVLTATRPAKLAKPAHQHDHGSHGHPQASHGTGRAGSAGLMPDVKTVVAIASGKGGVGKSTTTANLACALASQGLRVGLLDADIYGPSQPRMLGITGKPKVIRQDLLEPLSAHGVKCMSIGFIVPEDTPMVWRGPMVMGALRQLMGNVDWGTLDILLVDMPPGTGDTQLTMSQSVKLAGAVIVSTPQDIALLDARKGLNMFRQVDVPVLGIVENMSYFNCPNCGHRTDIFSHGGARHEAAALDTPFLGEIPLDIAIRETSDAGTPIVVADPQSPHAEAYQAIARAIWAKVGPGADQASRQGPRIVMQ